MLSQDRLNISDFDGGKHRGITRAAPSERPVPGCHYAKLLLIQISAIERRETSCLHPVVTTLAAFVNRFC